MTGHKRLVYYKRTVDYLKLYLCYVPAGFISWWNSRLQPHTQDSAVQQLKANLSKRHANFISLQLQSATQVCCTLWVFSLNLLNNYLLVLVNIQYFVFQFIIIANNHNQGVSSCCSELTWIRTLVKKHSLVCCKYIDQLNELCSHLFRYHTSGNVLLFSFLWSPTTVTVTDLLACFSFPVDELFYGTLTIFITYPTFTPHTSKPCKNKCYPHGTLLSSTYILQSELCPDQPHLQCTTQYLLL